MINKLVDINLNDIFLKSTTLKIGKGRGCINLNDFMSKEKKPTTALQRGLTGMYCKDGIAVASDTHSLIAIKASYDNKYENKIVAKDGTILQDATFPHWKSVIPAQSVIIKDGLDAFLAAANEANERLKLYKSCNKRNGKSIEYFKEWKDWDAYGNCKGNQERIYITITINGATHYFNLKQANAIAKIVKHLYEPCAYLRSGKLVIINYGLVIVCLESFLYDNITYPIFRDTQYKFLK